MPIDKLDASMTTARLEQEKLAMISVASYELPKKRILFHQL